MAQASRMAKAIIYKKKGTHPKIARMAKSKMPENTHKMSSGEMMSDKEMSETMKVARISGKAKRIK